MNETSTVIKNTWGDQLVSFEGASSYNNFV